MKFTTTTFKMHPFEAEAEPLYEDPVVQYIIVRNDLDSMTPGRQAAQAAHAANQSIKHLKDSKTALDLVEEWEREAKDFGTTIVLQADWDTIQDINDRMSSDDYFRGGGGIVHDPEYHVEDGWVTHKIPLNTALWIFGRKSQIQNYVEYLELL